MLIKQSTFIYSPICPTRIILYIIVIQILYQLLFSLSCNFYQIEPLCDEYCIVSVIPIWQEPIPGWTDNINGPTGLLIGNT